jgi:peptidoglycan hydrolase CwlO-like protein
VLSRQEVKDLTLKIDRNSNDIAELYELLEKTDKKVDNLTTDVTGLRRDVTGLGDDVTGLQADVTILKTDVTEIRIDIRKLDNRFDQLVQLLIPTKD